MSKNFLSQKWNLQTHTYLHVHVPQTLALAHFLRISFTSCRSERTCSVLDALWPRKNDFALRSEHSNKCQEKQTSPGWRCSDFVFQSLILSLGIAMPHFRQNCHLNRTFVFEERLSVCVCASRRSAGALSSVVWYAKNKKKTNKPKLNELSSHSKSDCRFHPVLQTYLLFCACAQIYLGRN